MARRYRPEPGRRSGQVGGFVGVALTDPAAMAAGVVNTGNPVGNASVALDGTWSVPCADAVATVGTALYLSGAGPFTVTTTVGANTLFGYSADVIRDGAPTGGTKAAGAGTINVKIGG